MAAANYKQRTIDEFRAKGGRGLPPWGDNILLMTSTGARSGERITNPVVMRKIGDDYVVVASKGGAPTNPNWYHNVQANPEVEVEVGGPDGIERFRARARAVPDGPEHERLYKLMTEVWPSFADYQAKTSRVIPVVVLTPIS